MKTKVSQFLVFLQFSFFKSLRAYLQWAIVPILQISVTISKNEKFQKLWFCRDKAELVLFVKFFTIVKLNLIKQILLSNTWNNFEKKNEKQTQYKKEYNSRFFFFSMKRIKFLNIVFDYDKVAKKKNCKKFGQAKVLYQQTNKKELST
ncbi:hypothetical protein RFI_15433 [Reticulomyxa filosa]|uniref:Uncharacterized protein n=1 Tax=Reticulomyxa filosa TaxID=46433 RepID=X6N7N6_RETFI|nr:hypothetical protein RFI_15433 [Reticulomyxa filosa]|eukprot:ETO21769.1 hypothetical protein RFI_15433 [Reticulomyxa filosa]